MNNRCDKCVADKSLCDNCRDNPKYADYPKFSKFMAYIPVCPAGYIDCVYDPAYIKYYNPEWYNEMWGDKTPEEVVVNSCKDLEFIEGIYCDHYDDEDK